MGIIFIIIGGLIIGMIVAKYLRSPSKIRLPKHLRTKEVRYFTNGQIITIAIKRKFNFARSKR